MPSTAAFCEQLSVPDPPRAAYCQWQAAARTVTPFAHAHVHAKGKHSNPFSEDDFWLEASDAAAGKSAATRHGRAVCVYDADAVANGISPIA